MQGCIRYAALLAVVVLAASCQAADENLRKLTEGSISIWYPPGMENQAKRVAQVAVKRIAPSVAVHRQVVALLSNVDAVSKHIADLLGAEEKQDDAQARLQDYRDRSQALAACFSNIRLVRKSAAAAAGGVDGGVMKITYEAERDEFRMSLDYQHADSKSVANSFFPVIINTDGSVRSESKLAEMALEFLGVGEALAVAPIHETVGYIMAQELKLFHPLARWFNEGVSAYITRQVIARASPKLVDLLDRVIGVSPKSRERRDRINFIAWPQMPYQNRRAETFDTALEVAHSQYAAEMMASFLGKDGAQKLPRIMGNLNYSGNPDTEAICRAITRATGRDFTPVLMEYVPDDIREGIKSGEAEKLCKRAEELVGKKEWAKAADSLRRALQMTPQDVNARLNLAWIERLTGERLDSEVQVFLCAALLEQTKYTFHLYAPSIEGNYILGRLAILMGNLESARQFLDSVLAYKPDHKDAKRALAEIEKLEKAAKGS